MYIEEIKNSLPQRYPFLFIDRITKIDLKDKVIYCYKNVSMNENFFNGHFPNGPIMPGVLILEAMAQAAGILGYAIENEAKTYLPNELYLFAGVDKVRFKHSVIPGDRLDLQATLHRRKSYFAQFYCEAKVDDTLACSANILCAKKSLSP